MTVKELRDILDQYVQRNPEKSDRKIEIYLQNYTIGEAAGSEIIGFYEGFDWDTGRIFLHAKDRIIKLPKKLPKE